MINFRRLIYVLNYKNAIGNGRLNLQFLVKSYQVCYFTRILRPQMYETVKRTRSRVVYLHIGNYITNWYLYDLAPCKCDAEIARAIIQIKSINYTVCMKFASRRIGVSNLLLFEYLRAILGKLFKPRCSQWNYHSYSYRYDSKDNLVVHCTYILSLLKENKKIN